MDSVDTWVGNGGVDEIGGNQWVMWLVAEEFEGFSEDR